MTCKSSGRRRAFSLLGSLALFLLALPARAAPDDAVVRVTSHALEVQRLDAVQILDLIYGNNGLWTVSDGIGDQLLEVDFGGNVKSTTRINLLAFNLYLAGGSIFFNAFDASSQPRVGYVHKAEVHGAFLPSGFLSQGGGVAARGDRFGASFSRSQSSLELFHADEIYSLTPVSISGGPLRGIDVGPGGNIYVGLTGGIASVTYTGAVSRVPSYTLTPLTLRACGDYLWAGGSSFMDRLKFDGDQVSVVHAALPFSVMSIDCGQGGIAVGAGTNGYLSAVDPLAGTAHAYQTNVNADFVKVSLGPGLIPNGLALTNQGSLANFRLVDINSPNDRNSSTARLLPLNLRTSF
jgi:hypothetical protein